MKLARSSSYSARFLGLALVATAGCASSGAPELAGSPGGASGTRSVPNGACLTPNTLSQADYGTESAAHVEQLLSRIPGVRVSSSANGFSVQIRGVNTLVGGSEPLYLIDGVPYVGDRTDVIPVNPADIECVEVLKDVGQTSIFGVRGANGVVLITTRRGGL